MFYNTRSIKNIFKIDSLKMLEIFSDQVILDVGIFSPDEKQTFSFCCIEYYFVVVVSFGVDAGQG